MPTLSSLSINIKRRRDMHVKTIFFLAILFISCIGMAMANDILEDLEEQTHEYRRRLLLRKLYDLFYDREPRGPSYSPPPPLPGGRK